MSRLLIPGEPLQVLPLLAKAIGLNEAIFIQQLHYWLGRSKHEHDGRVWVYNTFEEWQEQFPFWSLRTMQRIAASLVKRNLLKVHKFGSKDWDQKNWYSIDYEALSLIDTDHAKLASSKTTKRRVLDHAKMASSYKDQEITQETTTETRERAKGYKQEFKPPEEKTQLPPPDFDVTPDLKLWLAEMQIAFPLARIDEITVQWRMACEAEGVGRFRSLTNWQAKWKKYVYWTWTNRNSNGNGHKKFEQEYTGPVKSKPNPKLEICADCGRMGNMLVEVNGEKYAKVCRHERSEVAVA